jgi:hypothetical protein
MTSAGSAAWMRNHNAVRYNSSLQIGSLMHAFILFLVAVAIGLFALTQGTKVAQYDADIANVNSEIAELEARRDALAVENAKITAAAANDSANAVAAAMTDVNTNAEFVKD